LASAKAINVLGVKTVSVESTQLDKGWLKTGVKLAKYLLKIEAKGVAFSKANVSIAQASFGITSIITPPFDICKLPTIISNLFIL